MKKILICAALIGSALLIGKEVIRSQATSKKPIPVETLFSDEGRKLSPQLSPDGNKIAYLATVEGILNIWIRSIDGNEEFAITNDKQGIHRFFWDFDNQHIFYLKDTDGDENHKLYRVDMGTKDTECLTPFDDTKVTEIHYKKDHPARMLIGLNKRDPQCFDIYELNLDSKALTLVDENPGTAFDYAVSSDLACIARLRSDDEGGIILEVKNEEWQPIQTWTYQERNSTSPALVGLSEDNTHVYMIDPKNGNTEQLIKLSLETCAKELIFQDPEFDLEDVILHPDSHAVQAVQINRARKEYVLFDDELKAHFNIFKTLDHGDCEITSRPDHGSHWIIKFERDNGPENYWLYNHVTKSGTILFSTHDLLNNYQFGSTEPIIYQARDGLLIHAYLTKPIVEHAEKPMVVYVHGGPHCRDNWQFEQRKQFLATRGYAVLQINYRGSSGYGKSFIEASTHEWGGKMHDDLIDGVNWAVAQGHANPKKVAIMGGSYGGYAALVGATFTPDVFCCAVDVVGPSNLVTLLKSFPAYWSSFMEEIYRRWGHPEKDKEFLESRSPLFKVANIKIPMLIAHGKNDVRVKQAEADQIVSAMKERGIPHTYMLFEDEGHGFKKPQNKIKFFKAVEKFLKQHLG